MNRVSSTGPVRFRRLAAALMAIVMFMASFAVTAREPVPQTSAGRVAMSAFVTYGKNVRKPCQKSVVPGTVNLCPLSSFNLTAIPTAAPDYAIPASLEDAHWRVSSSSLPPQCGGLSPYRPPCAIV